MGYEVNSWSSKWCMTGFHFPDLADQLEIKEFTQVDLKVVPRISHSLFYTFLPHLDTNSERPFYVPTTLDILLDSYFSLDEETMSVLDSAIGYNVSAIELFSSKRTLSLLASFTSLETMVNLEYRDSEPEKCNTCNQLRFSIAKKFREYLLKYIGSSAENKKEFNSYYNLRSNIIHTGMRLKSELLFSEFTKEDLDSEYLKRVNILQIGKLAIANWLLVRLYKENA